MWVNLKDGGKVEEKQFKETGVQGGRTKRREKGKKMCEKLKGRVCN